MDARVARGYSDALFTLASESKAWELYKQELKHVVDTLHENDEMMIVLAHPRVSKVDKKVILGQVFEGQIQLYVLSFLKLLIDKNRFRHIFEITKAFTNQFNEQFGIEVAYVTSARLLDKQEEQALITMLENKTSKKIELVTHIDESLMAGIRIKIKDEVLDNSAKTRLKRMRNEVNGASL